MRCELLSTMIGKTQEITRNEWLADVVVVESDDRFFPRKIDHGSNYGFKFLPGL